MYFCTGILLFVSQYYLYGTPTAKMDNTVIPDWALVLFAYTCFPNLAESTATYALTGAPGSSRTTAFRLSEIDPRGFRRSAPGHQGQ